ncbi:hypothetical protein [Clostridioides difficile]|nr:hypothetical protein [Clostridioides difficile]
MGNKISMKRAVDDKELQLELRRKRQMGIRNRYICVEINNKNIN